MREWVVTHHCCLFSLQSGEKIRKLIYFVTSCRWRIAVNVWSLGRVWWKQESRVVGSTLCGTHRFKLRLIWLAAICGKSLSSLRNTKTNFWSWNIQLLCDNCQKTFPPLHHIRTGSMLQLQFFTLIDEVRCQSTIPRQPGEPWQLQSSGAALGLRWERAGRTKEACFP